jgi:hypothetical protein
MAVITINTDELSQDQLGVLFELLSNDTVSTNGHPEPEAPAPRTVPAKAAAKTTTAKSTTAKRRTLTKAEQAAADEELVDEPVGDAGDDEPLDDDADAEPAEGEEEPAEGLSQQDLENMSLVEVRKVATFNGVDFTPTTKKLALVEAIMEKAEADWLAEQDAE